MIYLSEANLNELGVDWSALLTQVEQAAAYHLEKDFAQPVKPYLRYRDLTNRIIAMPAFIGGNYNMAGIKWIASFPKNIDQDIPRAHSVTILNDGDTGIPVGIVNTPKISGLRTAAVTGTVIRKFLEARPTGKLKVGMTGFGPIGQLHLDMLEQLFADRIESLSLYDLRKDRAQAAADGSHAFPITVADSWEEAYQDADMFITCTVSSAPYINIKPKAGSLQLNVSLRDYTAEMKQHMGLIIVDDWEEVCRENTDIENMHKNQGLNEEDTIPLGKALLEDHIEKLPEDAVVMFNPMGMAIFDIAVATYYHQRAQAEGVGARL